MVVKRDHSSTRPVFAPKTSEQIVSIRGERHE
jgi:hypothetical protein